MQRSFHSFFGLFINVFVVYFLARLQSLDWYVLNRFEFFSDEVADTLLYQFVQMFFGRSESVYVWYAVLVGMVILAWVLRGRTEALLKKLF